VHRGPSAPAGKSLRRRQAGDRSLSVFLQGRVRNRLPGAAIRQRLRPAPGPARRSRRSCDLLRTNPRRQARDDLRRRHAVARLRLRRRRGAGRGRGREIERVGNRAQHRHRHRDQRERSLFHARGHRRFPDPGGARGSASRRAKALRHIAGARGAGAWLASRKEARRRTRRDVQIFQAAARPFEL